MRDHSEHVATDELADAGLGLVDDVRAEQIAEHVASCAVCTARARDLVAVEQALAALPTPSMPADVVLRLDGVIAAEQHRRADRPLSPVGSPAPGPRPTLGTFAADPPRRPLRLVRTLALAAAAALAVGFGGYVVSASAGLDDPTAGGSATQLSSSDLAEEARDLAGGGELSAHVFSPSWWCANRVVKGRITGLAPAVVDGTNALLVYTKSDGARRVTVVRGCPQAAVAGPSVVLSS